MLQTLQVEQMKDYIHQSLAYIAYTTTVATQKVSSLLFGGYDDDDNDQESDNIYEEYDEVCKESDDNYPTNQIDEGLKLQCDDLDRLGSAVGELAIQVFFPVFIHF